MKYSILAAFFAMLIGLVSPSYADAIATVFAVQGTPQASGPGGTRALAANANLFEHDKISVSFGNAQILFKDGTKLVVGPSSSLVIEKYLMRGGNTAQKFSINALHGTFRFITGNSAKKAYNIKTANATIGIRGTGFDFWVANNTGVAVHQGKVRLAKNGFSSAFVNIDAGCQLGVTKSNGAEQLHGQSQSNALQRRLPYTIDQRSLTQRFRLNISACRKFIVTEASSNQGSSKTSTHEEAPQCIPQCHEECSYVNVSYSCHTVCSCQ